MSDKEWLLKIAAEVDANPDKWTKYRFAADAKNRAVAPRSKKAVCWCIMGFCHRDGRITAPRVLEIYHSIGGLSGINDSLGKASDFTDWLKSAAEVCVE